MAHTLASFGFDDGQFLCVSVERCRQALAVVFAAAGLFRSYELMFVLGTSATSCGCGRISVVNKCICIVCVCLRKICDDGFSTAVEGGSRDTGRPTRLRYNPVTSNCTTICFTMTATPRTCRGG